MQNLETYIQSFPFLAFVMVFFGGVLVSFTPCVYPIIPLTIGVIGSANAESKMKGFLFSVTYVLGICVMYSALGAFAALTGQLFGEVGSSPWSYLIVGNICIILSLMLFEIIPFRLPGFMPRVSAQRTKSGRGFISIFFMGILSALIMSPCTAAPLGVVLTYVATKQNIFYGITLLFTFALGMGMLLIIVGTFAGIISAMPKPGPWMDRIRKGMAFLLLIAGELLLIKAGRLF